MFLIFYKGDLQVWGPFYGLFKHVLSCVPSNSHQPSDGTRTPTSVLLRNI